MIREFKKNYKLGIAFILGIIVSGGIVYATTSIESKNVSYDNTKSGMNATTMQQALDELYEKNKKQCKVVDGDKATVGSTVNCGGENFYISTAGETTTLIAQYGLNSTYKQSIIPTAVNYSDATNYIENYVNITLPWLKGNIISYGHTTYSEVKKLGNEVSGGAVIGDKMGLDAGAYWTSATTVMVYQGSVYSNLTVVSTSTSVESQGAHTIFNIYARPMIKVVSSIIQ